MHPPVKRFSWVSTTGVQHYVSNPKLINIITQSNGDGRLSYSTTCTTNTSSSNIQHQHESKRPMTSQVRPGSTPFCKVKKNCAKPDTNNRPKTASSCIGGQMCDRFNEVCHEPTRCHKLGAHLRLKRAKSAPLHVQERTVSRGQGYVLNKNHSGYSMVIETEGFFPEAVASARKIDDHDRDWLIADLQQQISDLTVLLEEEKRNHRQSRLKATDKLKEKLVELKNEHEKTLQEMESDQKEEVELTRIEHEKEFTVYKISAESQIARMKNENEFLQNAFNTYKGTLHSEMDERWAKMEADLALKHHEEMYTAINDVKMKLLQQHTNEKTNQMNEVQKRIEQIRAEHKRELNILLKRFSNVAADLKKLQETKDELAETKAALDLLNEDHKKTCQQLLQLTNNLTDTKVKLASYEESFEEKVEEVGNKYLHQLDDLRSQNTELRRMYSKKCSELFNERDELDQERVRKMNTAQDTMKELVHIRHRSNLSLVTSAITPTSKTRRSSVPITPEEMTAAKKSVGNVKTGPK